MHLNGQLVIARAGKAETGVQAKAPATLPLSKRMLIQQLQRMANELAMRTFDPPIQRVIHTGADFDKCHKLALKQQNCCQIVS